MLVHGLLFGGCFGKLRQQTPCLFLVGILARQCAQERARTDDVSGTRGPFRSTEQ
jgi:hypothetical protein